MEDEDIILSNACTDLVSLKEYEAFPLHLLGGKSGGEWLGVHEFCRQAGLSMSGLKPHLFATWLPDPMGNEGYVVILFYDDESKWSLAAHYNRQRLLEGAAPHRTPQLIGTGPVPRRNP
jgi:hypothetical protein